ncbi:hypothetical protein HK405_011407 [Cladochytrium tenue]|nr:hypothetical protein HK405_011407 [Cladochytrium tenue]
MADQPVPPTLATMPATIFLEVASLLSLRELLHLRLGSRQLRLAVDGLAFSSLGFARRHIRSWLARSLPDHRGPIKKDDDATWSPGSGHAQDIAVADCLPDLRNQFDLTMKEWRAYQESPELMADPDDAFYSEVVPPRQDYWEPGLWDKAWPTLKRVTSLNDFKSEFGFDEYEPNEIKECVSLFDMGRASDKSW